MIGFSAVLAGLWPRPRIVYDALVSCWRPAPIQRPAAEAVLAHYPLRLPAGGWRRPLTPDGRSRNVLLNSGGARLVLKQYKATMRPDGIQYEHALLQHLAAARFPAPRLVASRDSQTWVTHDGRYYAVFEYLDGFNAGDYLLGGRREQRLLEQGGQALAQYHRLVADFQPTGRKADGLTPAGLWWWQDAGWFARRWSDSEAALASRPGATGETRFWSATFPRLRRMSAALIERLAGRVEALPKTVIHGDYGPYNLLVDGDGLVAVLDFECAHTNLRLTDLIMALTRFAGTAAGLASAKANRLLKAYDAANPLLPGERKLFVDLFALWQLRRLAHYLVEPSAGALAAARQTLTWLEALTARPEIVPALA